MLSTALRRVCPREASGCHPRRRSALARRALLGSCAWRRHDQAESRPTVSPFLSDMRREWQPIHDWRYSARLESFRAREAVWCYLHFAAICGRWRRPTRKAGRRSCPGPSFLAPQPRLRHTASKNRSPTAHRDPTSSSPLKPLRLSGCELARAPKASSTPYNAHKDWGRRWPNRDADLAFGVPHQRSFNIGLRW